MILYTTYFTLNNYFLEMKSYNISRIRTIVYLYNFEINIINTRIKNSN